MAITYTVGQALDLLSRRFKSILQDGFGHSIADEALGHMWLAYPWKQSIATLTPFYLVPERADYGAPAAAVPSDYLHLYKARVIDTTGYGVWPLSVRQQLELSIGTGTPEAISYEPDLQKFRLSPRPASGMAAPRFQVEGSYKKTPTKITQTNINSVKLPWDDIYFGVYRAVLLWKFYEHMQDQKELEQFQKAQALMFDMAQKEDAWDGGKLWHPKEALALG